MSAFENLFTIPKGRGHDTPRQAMWGSIWVGQEAGRSVGKAWAKGFITVVVGRFSVRQEVKQI